MQIKQIETFYWAARLGSFVKAARHMNATTSSVSMRIQELEVRLGVVLFDRAHKKSQLTSHGLHLLPLAEQLLAASDRILGRPRRPRNWKATCALASPRSWR